MTKLFENLHTRANDTGVNLSELCRAAKVPRKWLERLKDRVPKSVQYYVNLEQTLTERTDKSENQ